MTKRVNLCSTFPLNAHFVMHLKAHNLTLNRLMLAIEMGGRGGVSGGCMSGTCD